MKKIFIFIAIFALVPVAAHAQQFTALEDLVSSFGDIVRTLVPIVFSIAVLVFFWGLVKFIGSAGDETARASGRHTMVWGIIALAVMATLWGLVTFLTDSFGIDQNVDAPTVTLPQ